MSNRCPGCGKEVEAQEFYCSQCGTEIPKTAEPLNQTMLYGGSESPASSDQQDSGNLETSDAFNKTLLMGQAPDFVNDIPEGEADDQEAVPQAQALNPAEFETPQEPSDGQAGMPDTGDWAGGDDDWAGGAGGEGGGDDDFGDDWRGKGGGGGGGKFRIIAMIVGAVVVLFGLLIAVHLYLSPIKVVEDVLGIESNLAGFKAETEPREVQKSGVPKAEEPKDASAEESAAAEEDAGAKESLAQKGNCKPLSRYPEFPHREYLKALLGGSDDVGVCALFDMSVEEAGSRVGDAPKFGPTGYDLLPNTNVLEVYLGGKLDRRQSRIELVFFDDKLFEVHLIYASPFDAMSVLEGFKKDKFKEAFGDLDEEKVGGSIMKTDFTDGDILVSLVERKAQKKGRKRKKGADKKTEPVSIVFAKKAALESMGDAEKNRKAAQKNLAKGLEIFYSDKADKSKKYFSKARKQISDLGAAYNLEARLAIHKEAFKDAIKSAEKAQKASRDARVTAEANEILSIVFVYLGKKKNAITMIEKAKELDSAETSYALALGELKNGEYKPARVARAAALMSCKKEKRGKKWSTDGILARTYFIKKKIYKKELKKAKKSDGFKDEKERWEKLECP